MALVVSGVLSLQEDQKAIYYVTADSRASAQMSPALEKASALGYDVLFMTEPLDELTVQAIGEFGGKTLTDLGKENVDLAGDEDEKLKKEEQSSDTQGELSDESMRASLLTVGTMDTAVAILFGLAVKSNS